MYMYSEIDMQPSQGKKRGSIKITPANELLCASEYILQFIFFLFSGREVSAFNLQPVPAT